MRDIGWREHALSCVFVPYGEGQRVGSGSGAGASAALSGSGAGHALSGSGHPYGANGSGAGAPADVGFGGVCAQDRQRSRRYKEQRLHWKDNAEGGKEADSEVNARHWLEGITSLVAADPMYERFLRNYSTLDGGLPRVRQ